MIEKISVLSQANTEPQFWREGFKKKVRLLVGCELVSFAYLVLYLTTWARLLDLTYPRKPRWWRRRSSWSATVELLLLLLLVLPQALRQLCAGFEAGAPFYSSPNHPARGSRCPLAPLTHSLTHYPPSPPPLHSKIRPESERCRKTKTLIDQRERNRDRNRGNVNKLMKTLTEDEGEIQTHAADLDKEKERRELETETFFSFP